jgi:hypothetical protein
MFRTQVPPRPLDQAMAGFVKLLQEQFGEPATQEVLLREFMAALNAEIGHPVTILTRKRFARAAERAITTVLAHKR